MPGRYRFSMPSSRGHSDPWFRVGTVDVTTTIIVAFLCVVSFFVYAADKATWIYGALIGTEVKHGQVWRLVTWPLLNQPDIWVAVGIAIFWWFGKQVEAQLGRVHYLWLLLLITLIPAAIGTFLDTGAFGIRWLEIPIFVIFVCENPKAPFFFGIQAWVLAVVIVGIDILQLIGDRLSEQLLMYVAAIVVGVWTARSMGMINDFQWLPKIKLPGGGRGRSGRKRRSAGGGGGRSGGSSGPVVVDGPWPTTPIYRPMQDQAEVDQILDKIALVGMEGLTADEKKRLNEASKRLRKGGN